MTKSYFPVALKLQAKRALVVGGGKIAERKVTRLLQFGALVKVVSPDATSALGRMAKAGSIRWLNRAVRSSDIKSADIVIAATSQASVNRKVSRWAHRQGVMVNVVDNSSLSDFISPAVFRTAKAVVAVDTNGQDPKLSRDLKNFIKEHWNEFISHRHRLQKHRN